MKIFMICPVREATDELYRTLLAYAEKLERQGYKVHLPKRDTIQDDPTGGYAICLTNSRAIYDADEIHIWYEEASSGSKFDMGCVFMLVGMLGYKKKIVMINEAEAKAADNKAKSFLKAFRPLIARR